jgi:hypothetical protein
VSDQPGIELLGRRWRSDAVERRSKRSPPADNSHANGTTSTRPTSIDCDRPRWRHETHSRERRFVNTASEMARGDDETIGAIDRAQSAKQTDSMFGGSAQPTSTLVVDALQPRRPVGATSAVPATVAVTPPSTKVPWNVQLIALPGTGAGLTSSNWSTTCPATVTVPVTR